ncbi:MAG: hypothetical protein ABR503_05350 [Chitinophagaceae bacterium]
MKKIACLLTALFLFITGSYSQYIQDIHGRPYFATKYSEYQGSPFLFDNWKEADVITAKGEKFEKMIVNVDLYGNTALFNRNDTVYMFIEDIKEFSINEGSATHFFKKGKAMNAQLPDVFMQVLSSKPLIAKSVTKQLVEMQGYGTATKVYNFAQSVNYYGEIDGSVQKIKLTKADAQKLFYKKWEQVQTYAASNNLSYKTDTGWMQLLLYYQSLHK